MWACLLGTLTACGTEPVQPAPEVIKIHPPAVMLIETSLPPFVGATNGDLAGYIDELINALGQCNADKATLRAWAQ